MSVIEGANERAIGRSYHSTLRVSTSPRRNKYTERLVKLTVAVNCAVSAWLFPIAFDFLASTLVACAGYTPPLLHGLWLWPLVVGDIIDRRLFLLNFGAV
jgi:hypothetical protein